MPEAAPSCCCLWTAIPWRFDFYAFSKGGRWPGPQDGRPTSVTYGFLDRCWTRANLGPRAAIAFDTPS